MTRIFLLLLFIQTAYGQQDVVLSLDDAILLATDTDYGIAIAEKNVELNKINNNWASAGRFFNLDLVATSPQSIVRNNRPASFINGEIYSGAAGIQLQADVPIYQGGQVEVNKKILENAVAIAKSQKDITMANAIRDVKLQYYTTALSLESIGVITEVLSQTEERLFYEESRRDFGISNTFNSLQLESNFLSDSIQLLSQISAYRQSSIDLVQILNLQADSVRITPLDTLAYRPKLYDYTELKSKLLTQNSEIQQLLLTEQERALQVELERKSKNPQISLNGSLGFTENAFAFLSPPEEFEGGLQFGNESNIGVTLSARYNLLDGGRRKRAIESAQVQLSTLQLQKLELEQQLSNQLAQLIEQYNDLLEQVSIQNRNLVLSARNISIGRERFESGKINSLDFRDLQINYINAEFSRLNLLFNLNILETNIEWLTGDYTN